MEQNIMIIWSRGNILSLDLDVYTIHFTIGEFFVARKWVINLLDNFWLEIIYEFLGYHWIILDQLYSWVDFAIDFKMCLQAVCQFSFNLGLWEIMSQDQWEFSLTSGATWWPNLELRKVLEDKFATNEEF